MSVDAGIPIDMLERASPVRSRFHWGLVGGILLLGVALRWHDWGGPSVWFDEAYTAWAAGLAPGKLVDVVRVDNSPPLYYLFMHGWTAVFGESERALRAPSALAGTIVLLGTLRLARRLFNDPHAEVVAVLLASVSFLQIRYAQEARCYEILSLCALVALFGFVDLEQGRTKRGHVRLVLGLSAMTWMHNMAWLFVASVLTAELVWPSPRAFAVRLKTCVMHGLIVVGLFVLWMPALLAQTTKMAGGFWIPRPDDVALYYMGVLLAGVKVSTLAGLIKSATGSADPWLTVAQAIVAVSLGVLALALTALPDRTKRRRLVALGVAGLLPLLLAFVISLVGTSVFTPKALIASSVVLPLVGAGAATRRATAGRHAVFVCVVAWSIVALVSVVGLFEVERRENWRDAHRYLSTLPPAHRAIVFVGNDGQLGLDYYDRRDGRIEAARTGAPVGFYETDPPRAMQRVNGSAEVQHVDEFIRAGGYESVIFVGTHLNWSDPRDSTRQSIRAAFTSVERRNFDGVDVERFERPPSGSNPK